jgi:signal transduction histidine kinase
MSWWYKQRTLNIGLIVIGLLAILSSGASLFASKYMVQDMAVLTVGRVRDLPGARALRLMGLREISDASAAVLAGADHRLRAAREGSAAVREQVALLASQIGDSESRSLVNRIQTTERDYRDAFENAIAGKPSVSASSAVGSRGLAFEQALDDLVAKLEPAAAGALQATQASLKHTQTIFNVFTTLSIVLALFVCVLLIAVINRNYRDQASARILAEEGQSKSTADLNEAKAASQLKDQFLATISHELRNPLAPILTWTQLLRGGTLDKEKAERGLEVIERNVKSMSELIDDLVDVSRVVSGKFRLDVRPIDLLPAIKAAVESQRPASDAKQIRLQIVLDERAGMVSGDSERLQQVMGNLLSNAIKFTPKAGSVQVVLRRSESHVEITVSDSGIGIEPSFLPHVFEPFQQEMDGSMRRHGGLGLGLSIVRHIVELHGGEISATSEGPGHGATFTIQLPLLGTSEPSNTLRPRHPRATDGLTHRSAAVNELSSHFGTRTEPAGVS